MPKKRVSKPSLEVLRYRHTPQDRGVVRRHYALWRAEQGLPNRCDIPACIFHSQPMQWNGKELKPILDHKSGNSFDNSPSNLRYLCPNCDSQLPTRGGGNAGRLVERIPEGYTLQERDGSKTIARAGVAAGTSSAVGVGVAVRTDSRIAGDA